MHYKISRTKARSNNDAYRSVDRKAPIVSLSGHYDSENAEHLLKASHGNGRPQVVNMVMGTARGSLPVEAQLRHDSKGLSKLLDDEPEALGHNLKAM